MRASAMLGGALWSDPFCGERTQAADPLVGLPDWEGGSGQSLY